MTDRSEILKFLQSLAPLELAEDWDNVGLLLGRETGEVSKVLTCLTLTPGVAFEAVKARVQLIVTHHPILFRPVQSLTTSSADGGMLLLLIEAGIAVYSPHTAYDSAEKGINAQLAELFGLVDPWPIRRVDPAVLAKHPELQGLGSGRVGDLPKKMSLEEFAAEVQRRLQSTAGVQFVGDPEMEIFTVGIACGSAAEFLGEASRQTADVLLTGEARFHACLEARRLDIGLVLAGHYATERGGAERLAEFIQQEFPDVNAFPSQIESDPLKMFRGRV
jgi:dinuclear metal center YbgI/SA1388 family protein